MKIPILAKVREDLNNFIGSWNGDGERFLFEGNVYYEDDVDAAGEAIEKIDELDELHI